MTRWVWVSVPWATFLLGVRDGIVIEAAPIARRRALGKPSGSVLAFYRSQGKPQNKSRIEWI